MSATDTLLAQIPGAEIRLAGDHIEHCTICRDCKGAGRFLSEAVWLGNRFYPRRYETCEPCDGTGYASRTVCIEGDCAACDRAFSVAFPGNEMEIGMSQLVAAVLRSLPADALEARLALSIVAAKLGVDVSELKGIEDGAPTVSRHHAKEHE